MFKRLFDIVCSLVGLAVTAALFPFVALAIVIGDGLPVLVSLERVSSGRVIRVHKFRSMVRGAHLLKVDLSDRNERQDGPLFKMKNDPRVTVVGRVIRRFKVDEFPQFWEVHLSGRYGDRHDHRERGRHVRGGCIVGFSDKRRIDRIWGENGD